MVNVYQNRNAALSINLFLVAYFLVHHLFLLIFSTIDATFGLFYLLVPTEVPGLVEVRSVESQTSKIKLGALRILKI